MNAENHSKECNCTSSLHCLICNRFCTRYCSEPSCKANHLVDGVIWITFKAAVVCPNLTSLLLAHIFHVLRQRKWSHENADNMHTHQVSTQHNNKTLRSVRTAFEHRMTCFETVLSPIVASHPFYESSVEQYLDILRVKHALLNVDTDAVTGSHTFCHYFVSQTPHLKTLQSASTFSNSSQLSHNSCMTSWICRMRDSFDLFNKNSNPRLTSKAIRLQKALYTPRTNGCPRS